MTPHQRRVLSATVSWLSHCGAKSELSGGTLKVTGPAGTVNMKVDSLPADILNGGSAVKTCIGGAIKAIGLTVKEPDRGSSKVSTRDVELVAMRHSEFRRVRNPTAAEYEPFMPVIRAMSKKTHFRYSTQLTPHGLEVEDLVSYAMVWTANFLGLYYRTDKPQIENRRLLVAHLQQRFGNLIDALYTKRRRPVDLELLAQDQDLTKEETFEAMRPSVAKNKLTKALDKMNAQDRLSALSKMKNHSDPDIAACAKSYLDKYLDRM